MARNPHEDSARAGNKPGYGKTGSSDYRNVHDTGAVTQTPGPRYQPSSGNGATTTSNGTKTKVQTSKPKFVPSIAYNAFLGLQKFSHAHNLKKRTKFAQKEGLTRDWAKTHQWSKTPTLDVMSDQGKDYLKEAGYGPFQDKRQTGEGQDQKCPDGTMPPCPPVATQTPAITPPATGTSTSWQLYPENSNYLTGEGYDEGGGVKFGPPPKKGPNPQVPPVKFSRGGGAAIRGTKFSGVK